MHDLCLTPSAPERRQPRPRGEGGRCRRRGGGGAVHDPRRQPRTHGHGDVPGRHHAATACGQLLRRSRPQRPVRLPGVGGRPADGRQRRGCLLPATGRPRLRRPHGHLERHRPGRQPPRRVLDVPGGGRRPAGPERCGTAGRQRQRAAPPAACLHARRRRQRHRSGDAARAARRVRRGAVRHADRRPLRLRPGGRPGIRPPHDQRFGVGPLRQRDGAAAVGLRRGGHHAAGAG